MYRALVLFQNIFYKNAESKTLISVSVKIMDSMQLCNVKTEPINNDTLIFNTGNELDFVQRETVIFNILDELGNPTKDYIKTECFVTLIKQEPLVYFEGNSITELEETLRVENQNTEALDENSMSYQNDVAAVTSEVSNCISRECDPPTCSDSEKVTNHSEELTQIPTESTNPTDEENVPLSIVNLDNLESEINNEENTPLDVLDSNDSNDSNVYIISKINNEENTPLDVLDSNDSKSETTNKNVPRSILLNNSKSETNDEINMSRDSSGLNSSMSKKRKKRVTFNIPHSNISESVCFLSETNDKENVPPKVLHCADKPLHNTRKRLKRKKTNTYLNKIKINGRTFELKRALVNLERLSASMLLKYNNSSRSYVNNVKTKSSGFSECDKNNTRACKKSVKSNQKKEKGYLCKESDVKLSENIKLRKRILYYCNDCSSFKTKLKKNLIQHLKIHVLRKDKPKIDQKDNSAKNIEKKYSPDAKNPRDLSKLYTRYCKLCDKTYGSRNVMSNCLNCHERLLFQCASCHFKCTEYDTVRYHILTTCDPDCTEIKCSKCGKNFSSYIKLKQHFVRYCGVEPKFYCKLCPYKAKDNYKIKRHTLHIHMKQKSKTKSDTDKLRLWFHRVCQKCKKIFDNQSYRSTTKCNKCKIKFRYKCLKCKRDYSNYQSAIYHMKTICKPNNNLDCIKCRKRMKKNENVEKHMEECHKKYFCDHCNYTTYFKSTLITHFEVHNSTRKILL